MLPFSPPPPIAKNGRIYSHGHPVPSRGQATGTITHRQAHLLYLHSLLYTLLQRHPTLEGSEAKQRNADRVGRIIRVLWSVQEWRDGELWRLGMEWCSLDTSQDQTMHQEATSTSSQNGDGSKRRQRSDSAASTSSSSSSSSAASSASSDASSTFSDIRQRHTQPRRQTRTDRESAAQATQHRIAFLRAVSIRRRGLRPLLLAQRAQEMMTLGKWKEILDEIELVIQAEPYRSQPELNLYAGLLVVLLSSHNNGGLRDAHTNGDGLQSDDEEGREESLGEE